MEFLNPLMFWGILAIAIPVVIHLWHQKKGRLLPWAATRWLTEKKLQQSRGMKLENILLLLLRIALLLLLVLYFTKPLVNSAGEGKTHWVIGNQKVVENFRFELAKALKDGERVFWLNGDEITDLTEIPEQGKTDIQKGINRIADQLSGNETAEIYLNNESGFTRFSKVFVPVKYNLHVLKDTIQARSGKEIPLNGNRKLNVNEKGVLVTTKGFGDQSVTKFSVLMEENLPAVRASLKAITEVYGMEFEIDEKRNSEKKYDLTFTRKNPELGDGFTIIYGASENKQEPAGSNTLYIPDELDPQQSDLVFSGGLPEQIMEVLVDYLDLDYRTDYLTDKQINDLFSERSNVQKAESPWYIMLLFLMVLGVERWVAIQKNK